MNKIIDYIGSKEKLYDFIVDKIQFKYNLNDNIKILDLFSGSNVFSKMLYEGTNFDITLNDYQYFSYVNSYYIDSYINEKRLKNLLKTLDEESLKEDLIYNEFSFGGTPSANKETFENQTFNSRFYFTAEVGKKADAVKLKIKDMYLKKEIDENEKNILLLFLVNFLDKNANTTSIYAAYLKELNNKKEYPFINEKLITWIITPKNRKIKRMNLDVIDCLSEVEYQNVIYIDPPYNTRDYFTLYHILNYIVDLNFKISDIKPNSKTAIPNIKKINLFSQSKTKDTMFKIIDMASKKSEVSFLSYNNESIVKEEEFIEIFNTLKLNYKFHRKEHQRFISRTDRKSHTKIEEWLIEFNK
jgi:adenine-specific DNA-methyltransferase